jgi:hypothetical protein
VGQITKTSSPILVHKTDTILDKIGEPKNGTIAEVDKTILGLKSLVVHTDLVARHEEQQLTAWDNRGAILFNNLNGTVSDARATVKQSTLTLVEAQKAIATVETVPEHINGLTDQMKVSLIPLPSTLQGLTNASNGFANVSGEMATYIHGPLTFATNNAGELEDTTNTTLSHADQRWIAPWDGSHPFKHYAGAALGTGLQLGNLGATIVRDTK